MLPAIVTGATGFVGRVLAARIPGAHALRLSGADWREACDSAPLRGATIYHLAARVHGASRASDAQYMHDNAEKTRVLARCAAAAGARAFVFLSTIKVNGEETASRPFTPDDAPAPEDAYARSKLAAEAALAEIGAESGMRVVVVRSPLVYAGKPQGNLAALLRLADSAWPLPFAALHQPRSLVHVEDLCAALCACGERDAARGVYLVAHTQPATVEWLVTSMRRRLGRQRRLFHVAPRTLEALAALVGQGERARRLTRALVVDATRAQRELDWGARIEPAAAVREMVDAYRGGGAP
jgi:nucleoside-diphosphate-sugar epimerase